MYAAWLRTRVFRHVMLPATSYCPPRHTATMSCFPNAMLQCHAAPMSFCHNVMLPQCHAPMSCCPNVMLSLSKHAHELIALFQLFDHCPVQRIRAGLRTEPGIQNLMRRRNGSVA